MDKNIRTLQDEIRKAALYEELMTLEQKIIRLPTMNNVLAVEDRFQEYTKVDMYIKLQ